MTSNIEKRQITKVFLGFLVLVISFSLVSFSLYAQQAEQVKEVFQKLKWREIGPAVPGGRTVDIEAVEDKPWIIYAAVGPSGVWKSTNDGTTWEPIFYKEETVSVGDIAVAPSHPEIIWVGTGEATCRNSVTIGNGVYKSTNGGKKWQHMGLEETRHISRIVINPGDPNIVYVAAMGHLWGPNPERGVFKTTDGGRTWKKVLYIDENTGIADLVMDPSDTLTLYAAAYEHRRQPFYFSSGGPGSAIYKTTDGGQTWQKLTKDLPEGILGRIGLAVSRSNPKVVYALIEHKDGGIWRSEDKGQSWTRMGDKETYDRVNFRPFYYSQIRVDPQNDQVVYVFSGGLFVSHDGGKKFRPISAGTHPDHHDLWIDPHNPLHLIDGNDGGIDITYDGGRTWRSVQNINGAEVYQIGYDLSNPYFVYCGLQDNGVWGGPSAVLDAAGITNCEWFVVGGGDGFYCQVDPSDPNIIYANSQMNGLYRFDRRINLSKALRPEAPLTQPPYRYNWNSPIHISPHDPKTIYTGGNVLFRSRDRGQRWEIISPDLTTNDPKKMIDSGGPITPDNTGAEIHCTIITIAESPVKKGVIWCGTDDGNVQVTLDDGQTWTNVRKNIRGVPANAWCSRVEASHFEAGTAYVAFDNHRYDDYKPYVYKTTNFGKTWVSITSNLPFGWVHVIREDPRNPNLLYVGTEFGIFASLDGGKSWFSLKNNLPTVAVRDIAVHPRENDLIIGTHGRGIWIMDDIRPLQEMTPEVFNQPAHLFTIRPATQFYFGTVKESYTKQSFVGSNPPYGLIINTYFKEKLKERPRLTIRNAQGEEMFTLDLRISTGVQRTVWNLRFVPRDEQGKPIKPSALGFAQPPYAPCGEYLVEIKVGEKILSQKAQVLPDPRFEFSDEDRQVLFEAQVKSMVLTRKIGLAVTAIKNIRREIDKLNKKIGQLEEKPSPGLDSAIQAFEQKLKKLEDALVPPTFNYRVGRELALRGGPFAQQVIRLAYSISGFPGRPTQTDLDKLAEFTQQVDKNVLELNNFIQEDYLALNNLLKENGLKALREIKPIKLD